MSSAIQQQIVTDLMMELDTDQLVLPSLPDVALRVRDALADEDVSSSKLAEIIATDAALVARLIQVANSPLVRGNRAIDSVESAVTRMGNTMARNVVNSLIVQQMFQPTTEVSDAKFRAFWEHSSQVAAICHSMAGFARLKPDQAMLAGLVHDIGALPIIKRAEDIPELLENIAALDRIIAETHTKIGKVMLDKWQFPQVVANAAGDHENLGRVHDGPADYTDLVIVANLQSYFGTEHPHGKAVWGNVPAFAKLGLDTEVSVVSMEQQGESIRELQRALVG